MQTRLINESIAIRSRRFIKELKGFIWNAQTKRAEATKGFHDDAIMALCLALYARDINIRQVPFGVGDTEEEYKERFKAEIYEEIKMELAKASPDEWMDPDDLEMINGGFDMSPREIAEYARAHDKLLREFGW